MQVKKSDESSVIINNNEALIGIRKLDVSGYVINVLPNEAGERIFDVSNTGIALGYKSYRVYEILEDFVIVMFGNNVLFGHNNSPKMTIDPENKTITILSDSGNNASLIISFSSKGIRFRVIDNEVEPFNNSFVFCYSDCNLRGGYARMFRTLFEELETLALEPTYTVEESGIQR